MRFLDTLKNIKTYEAGKPIELVVREYGIEPEHIIKLASNENPYGTSPKVVKAIQENAHKAYLYPDDSMYDLKTGLASKYGVSEDMVIIGAGSDQVLEFCARAVLDSSSKVLMSRITFAMYAIYATQQGAQIIRSSCYRHDLDEFYELYKKHNPHIIHICTPNNPTGDAIEAKSLFNFLEKVKEPLVIVDGAYMEYAAFKDSSKKIDPKELVDCFDNVIYLGTFSKAYGLGGMRVGYGIASKEIIGQFMKLRPPFNITTLSLVAAVAALQDEEFVQSCIQKNFAQMDRFVNFAVQNKFGFIDSYTNFITYLLEDDISSKTLANELLKHGIIVRDLSSYELNALRITIGTADQNSRFFEIFKEVLDGYKK